AHATSRQSIFVVPSATATCRGDTDSWCPAPFCFLAPWLLGMVGLRGSIHISLRCGLLNAVGSNSNPRQLAGEQTVFSAKGAAFNLEPGATPQGLWRAQTAALKTRFITSTISIDSPD